MFRSRNPMPNIPSFYRTPPPSFLRRVLNRLMADRGPGKNPLWVHLAAAVGVLAFICMVLVIATYVVFARGLPSIDWARHYRPPIVSTVWSGDQQLMGEFYDERRQVVPYERIPKKLVQAVIAWARAAFFHHSGVSYTGIARALFKTYVLRHKMKQGGSTLTQQTARAILASADGVKAAPVRAAWAGERRKTRELILTTRLEGNF